MTPSRTFNFEGSHGTLKIELGEPSKQVYRGSVPPTSWKIFGLDEVNPNSQKERFLFEYQTVKYNFLPNVKTSGELRAPFQLIINNRVKSESTEFKSQEVHLLSGQFSIDDAVGQTQIEIRDARNKQLFGMEVEVYPQKMDYASDYKAMMAEVSSIVQNLTYDALKDTYKRTRAKTDGYSTESEWWSILSRLFEQLLQQLRVITRQPNHEILITEKVEPVERIKHASKRNRKWVTRNAHYIREQGPGVAIGNNRLLTHALSTRKQVTYDTFENRFVKWGIHITLRRLRGYRKQIQDYAKKQDVSPLLLELDHIQSRLQSILQKPPFNDAGEFEKQLYFSTTLTRGSGYREFLHIHLLLTRGLDLWENDIFKIDQKEISTLYEYWCYLKLIELIKDEGGFVGDYRHLIKIKAGKILVDLKKGKQSSVSFSNANGDIAQLYYERKYVAGSKSFTYDQKPDFSLRIRKKNSQEVDLWYLFDAKYRFDEGPKEGPSNFDAPLDSIGQMHRYRDAILHTKPDLGSYRKAIKNLGGYILYPYPKSENEYIGTRFHQSIQDVNIGALPFLPSKTDLVTELLSDVKSAPVERRFEEFIEMDRSWYEKQRTKWGEWVTINVIPKSNQEKRLAFFEKTGLVHVPFVKNRHSRLFRSNYILQCVAGTKMTYLAEVDQWTIMNRNELQDSGVDWALRHDRYVVFTTTRLDAFSTPVALSPRSFRFSSKWGIDQIRNGAPDKSLLFLTGPNSIRLYSELVDRKVPFNISWGRSAHDPSQVDFAIEKTGTIVCSEQTKYAFYSIDGQLTHISKIELQA